MTLEYLLILAVIAVLSVVQSIFGMGVLIFGTPLLILMGHDFTATLGYLLPASFAISLLQVSTAGESRVPISNHLYLLCLPAIGIGLYLTEFSLLASWVNILIGVTLLLSAFIRLSPPMRNLINALLKKHFLAYHVVMGAIHGMTNLGGAFLAILASGANSDKSAVRYTVAHYYLAFSAIQMMLLGTVMGHGDIILSNLPSAIISAIIYLAIGNRAFRHTSNAYYDKAFTFFIFAYGFIVLLKV